MIPKIIHYCWFGKNIKSDLIEKCFESWKKFCPDYKIIEWNEENFDINECEYVREAYEARKWAFVSDYVRHAVLNIYGGIYLDTDVELLKPLPDFLQNDFIALENKSSIASGLIMGCEKDNAFCKYMLMAYKNDHFIQNNGKQNEKTVCERTTEYFIKRGFKKENKIQIVDGFKIFPSEFFCPIDPITYEKKITTNTISIHHYGGSWCSDEQKEYLKLRASYAKKYPREIASTISFYLIQKKYKGRIKAIWITMQYILTYIAKK